MVEEPKPLELDQIKSILHGSYQNKNKQHAGYNYYECDDLETEINEFISYSEIKTELKTYHQEFNTKFPTWNQSTKDEQKGFIQQAIDDLENEEKRVSTLQSIAYISLGTYDDFMGQEKENHIERIKNNNQLLFSMDVVSILKKLLNQAGEQIEISSSVESVNIVCKEFDIYLTVMYLVIICNKQESISLQEYQVAESLFHLIVRLKEHFTKAFPLKKLMLVVWKVLLITLGDLNEEYQDMKKSIRQAYGLPIHQDKSTLIKCTPEDLYAFYQHSSDRYPTFIPKKPSSKLLKDSLIISPTKRLIQLMGLVEELNKTDLPFQTIFPSKNTLSQQQQQQQHAAKEEYNKIKDANLLPLIMPGSMIPHSLSEANQIWLDHLYISVANYQTIQERKMAINRWQLWKKKQQNQQQQEEEEEEEDKWMKHLNDTHKSKLEYIKQLYRSIVPYFHSIVVVVLKMLLSVVSTGKDKEAEIMEDVNITRNRETVSKAVSGILLLLLKWFKVSHVFEFEYFAQTLIDSGCMLLILKLLGLQEIGLLASRKTDDDSQSFFGYVQQLKPQDDDEGDKGYTNKRNLCWTINLLRILQMLSKGKAQRILLLVQYKSSAILKKLLKVGHPTVSLYVLKNLKNQVPYLGRKWRSSNMKTVSAIYSQCPTSLNDEWLSTPEGSVDTEDTTLKEKHLRTLIRLYNGRNYLSSLLPAMDEIHGPEKTYFYADVPNGLPEYSIHEPIALDDIELDVDFKQNYKMFLDKEVYSTDAEEEEDDEEHTWNIGTPLPDSAPTSALSHEEIEKEINRLYLEELNNEFQQQGKQTNGWDSPSGPNPSSSLRVDDEEDADEEGWTNIEDDPLTGIDWNSLTEEELNKRLSIVESNTVKRWMNVELDDPRYLKVLNPLNTEIETDEEGWPKW
ncbi:hypothetical protein G6F70_006432 [Rhizopus microsporus]|nr:hypothetical protein G6F71_003461 [Rhizopus microsporus]KAG1197671.1 hypothetical protein G6F70_006432 [Rhizopus microsporus]KAG1209385.1 hypothetical protein G6F69_006401 [Rhizopus microsporus]KAG1230907.1 hypothetical protein G6F67_006141 [Rhizopus microsporus]KAG1263197.1 hypothetical protein G6F68_005324 [Rhizopus microsporus]